MKNSFRYTVSNLKDCSSPDEERCSDVLTGLTEFCDD